MNYKQSLKPIGFKNIAISGDIGTGKSTLGKLLAEKLEWEYLSGGEHIREWYKEKGIDFSQINAVPEQVDRDLEDDFKRKMEEGSGIVFESRLAGYLAKDMDGILKILCVTDFEEAVKRVAKREGKGEKQVREEMKTRAEGLREKFKRLYGVDDFLDEKYFDLVCDTTKNSAESCLEMVMEKLTA